MKVGLLLQYQRILHFWRCSVAKKAAAFESVPIQSQLHDFLSQPCQLGPLLIGQRRISLPTKTITLQANPPPEQGSTDPYLLSHMSYRTTRLDNQHRSAAAILRSELPSLTRHENILPARTESRQQDVHQTGSTSDDAENVWEDASERLLVLKDALPTFPAASFCLAFDATDVYDSYETWLSSIGKYLDGGSTEFLTFEKRLLESLIAYGKAHSWSREQIEALEVEIDV